MKRNLARLSGGRAACKSWSMLRARGLLFDLDGVFVDSTESVERHWRMFAERYGLDAEELLTKIHGVPHTTTIRRELADRPGEIDAALARHENVEVTDAGTERALPGAKDLIASLPDHSWAVVTSCWHDLAIARAKAAGIQLPKILVTADQLKHGKPAPDGYIAAAGRLGIEPADCIVFEDARSGIEAALAAGAIPVALRTTTAESDLAAAHHIVDDLTKVTISEVKGEFEVRLE